MNDWYENLDQKEQRIVIVAGSLIGVLLIWLVLIRPLFSAAATQARRVEIRQQELHSMQELAGRVIELTVNAGQGGALAELARWIRGEFPRQNQQVGCSGMVGRILNEMELRELQALIEQLDLEVGGHRDDAASTPQGLIHGIPSTAVVGGLGRGLGL